MKHVKFMHKTKQSSAGFTLVELMIATVVFSVILIGATTAMIQIGRMYYKGVIVSRTQETARRTMDDITRPIQFAGGDVRISSPEIQDISGIQTGAICMGNKRFTYGINVQINSSVAGYSAANHRAPHALYQDELSSDTAPCTPLDLTVGALPAGREILSEHMRLAKFKVTPPSSGNMWGLEVTMIYGDDDLLVPDANVPTGCAGVVQGAQWCAVASLSTHVYKRIN